MLSWKPQVHEERNSALEIKALANFSLAISSQSDALLNYNISSEMRRVGERCEGDPQKRPQHFSLSVSTHSTELKAKGVRTIGGELGQMATQTWSDWLYRVPPLHTCLCLRARAHTPNTFDQSAQPKSTCPIKRSSEGRAVASSLRYILISSKDFCCGSRTKSDRTCKLLK